MQAERIRRQRVSGDRRVALQGRRVLITVDNVLQVQGKLMRNKALFCQEDVAVYADGDRIRGGMLV